MGKGRALNPVTFLLCIWEGHKGCFLYRGRTCYLSSFGVTKCTQGCDSEWYIRAQSGVTSSLLGGDRTWVYKSHRAAISLVGHIQSGVHGYCPGQPR